MDTTLEYYNANANQFAAGTVDVEFTEMQDRFLRNLQPGARLLDFGCGSGRDTKYFLSRGFEVDATDGSEGMCRVASEYTGIPVRQMLFAELNELEKYDGIWACSSILHLPKQDLKAVLVKITEALKPAGICYTSFKYSEFEGLRNGRYFTDFTETTFREFIKGVEGLAIIDLWITGDARPGRGEEKWLNLLLQKKG